MSRRLELRPEHALIRGLREPGSETELTRTLAGVLTADPEMASAFVRLVVELAPNESRISSTEVPRRLSCRAEESVAEGRLDLSFGDDDDLWHVIAEIKIHAGYGHEQIRRYLSSFRDDAERMMLVAITRDVPTYGDYAGDDSRWLGSVQWSRLLPGLRELKPQNSLLGQQWQLFFDVLESEGSMGFTNADDELFRAWANYYAARRHVMDFVDSVRRPLLEALRDALAEPARSPEVERASLADLVTRGKTQRAVVPRLGKVTVGFRVPATDAAERLWAGVWGWGDARFIVELPFPAAEAPQAAASVKALKQAGFQSWRDQHLTRYLPLDGNVLAAPDLQDRVLAFAAESFRAIVETRVLELQPSVDPASAEDTEEADVLGPPTGGPATSN